MKKSLSIILTISILFYTLGFQATSFAIDSINQPKITISGKSKSNLEKNSTDIDWKVIILNSCGTVCFLALWGLILYLPYSYYKSIPQMKEEAASHCELLREYFNEISTRLSDACS